MSTKTVMDLPDNTPKVAIQWIGELQQENEKLKKEKETLVLIMKGQDDVRGECIKGYKEQVEKLKKVRGILHGQIKEETECNELNKEIIKVLTENFKAVLDTLYNTEDTDHDLHGDCGDICEYIGKLKGEIEELKEENKEDKCFLALRENVISSLNKENKELKEEIKDWKKIDMGLLESEYMMGKDKEIHKLKETCMGMCKKLEDATKHEIEDPTKFYRGIVAVEELKEENDKLIEERRVWMSDSDD